MVQVRIEEGRAISVDDFMSNHTHSLLRNLFASFWNRYFADKYEVIEESEDFVELTEGCEYQGWPCGNGKVYLVDKITPKEARVIFSNGNRIA